MPAVRLADLTERYAFADPAGSRRKATEIKRVRARSAIVVVAPDLFNRLWVLYAWAGRPSTDHLTDRIIEVNRIYRPRVFGIEANAMQSLYADSVMREGKHAGVTLPLTAVFQPTGIDKDWRIRATLQEPYAAGQIIIGETMYELRNEIASFPMSQLKDMIDALASCVELVPRRTTRQQQDDDILELARYLRESGAPPHYIEQRILEVRAERGLVLA